MDHANYLGATQKRLMESLSVPSHLLGGAANFSSSHANLLAFSRLTTRLAARLTGIDCPDCDGTTTDPVRCEDCDRELGGGDA